MKYVVINSLGVETPIIFPETESHVDHVKNPKRIISAGFCRFSVDPVTKELSVKCWGISRTLNAVSRFEEDEELILQHNAFKGVWG